MPFFKNIFYLIAGVSLLAGSGCELRKKMYDQPKYETYEKTDFFGDGRTSRMLIEGTVARGHLNEDTAFHTGKANGDYLKDLPESMELTQELLDRGHERFEIHCAVCHGYTGKGDGFVVQRGYKKPTSYHDQRLKESDLGYFYEVMTKGYGVMSSYSYQVTPEDRWAIAAYIRTLQVSQNAPVEWVKTSHETLKAH